MIAEVENGNAIRLSLAFAAFPEIFDAIQPGPLQRVAYRMIHLLDPLIRLESSTVTPQVPLAGRAALRSVMCHHIPAALMVLLSLEFIPRPHHLRPTQRAK